MRGLILVDLDNVLDRHPRGRELECFVEGAAAELVGRAPRGLDNCIVALGLNTTTAADNNYRLSFAALRDAAARLTKALGAKLANVEIGLVLTMPQAADLLLERLARGAPSDQASGEYAFAALFSADRGLASSLRRLYDEYGWVQIPKTSLAKMWMATTGGRRLPRKPPPPARSAGSGAPPSSPTYSVVIDSDALAGWASTRSIDVPPNTDLAELSHALARDPWILSQVGATTKCLRGIRRIEGLPSAAPGPLLGVAKSDHVEVRGSAPPPMEVSGAEPASIGMGAVHFQTPGATIASRLPAGVVAMVEGTFVVDPREINVRAALQRLPVGVPLGAPFIVRFTQNARFVARVTPARFTLDGWWLKDTHCTAEIPISSPITLAHPVVEARAQMMRSPGELGGWRVAIRSVLQRGDVVRLESDLARGEIGQAWAEIQGTPIPAAVFAERTHHKRNDVIRVRPVHEHVMQTAGNYEDSLTIVPLVVPL